MSPCQEESLKVIFLDIDGVLLPFPPSSNAMIRLFPDDTLTALNILLKHTKAKLVLSSTWRVRDDFRNDILDCFEKFCEEHGHDGSCVLGQYSTEGFWSITDPNLHSERQWEILTGYKLIKQVTKRELFG